MTAKIAIIQGVVFVSIIYHLFFLYFINICWLFATDILRRFFGGSKWIEYTYYVINGFVDTWLNIEYLKKPMIK